MTLIAARAEQDAPPTGGTRLAVLPDPTNPTLAAIRGTTTTRTRAPGANHDGNRTEHRPTRR